MSRQSRARKLAWLRERIEPTSTVLVVGAAIPRPDDLGVDNIVERGLGEFAQIHALTYDEGDPGLGCPVTRGDACALPFANGSFDYIFSNAVIEHVGGTERAQRMLSESARVARKGAFHTTPDRWFPIEVHTLLPLLHWLPRRWQRAAFK
ncbi:MAG: class I SAM-dependent methyltransferase, partial [Nocardioidaceae bacterium]